MTDSDHFLHFLIFPQVPAAYIYVGKYRLIWYV